MVEILQAEIDKRKLPVHVAAILNDTVGTLMARSYTAPSEHGSLIGAVFGTGGRNRLARCDLSGCTASVHKGADFRGSRA